MNNHKIMKPETKGIKIFDLSLTPENASKLGYEYINDINYDLYALHHSLDDILKLIYTIDYKLGTPSQAYNFATFYGLYAPKKTNAETEHK